MAKTPEADWETKLKYDVRDYNHNNTGSTLGNEIKVQDAQNHGHKTKFSCMIGNTSGCNHRH